MASAVNASICLKSVSCSPRQSQPSRGRISGLRSVSLPINRKAYPSLQFRRSLQICCAMKQKAPEMKEANRCLELFDAKPDTVDKVCKIVRKQLALPDDSAVTGESKFAALGADSLDTVEIVMGLEEEFGISVEEESAQSITTVQEAADMIEKLIEKKGA